MHHAFDVVVIHAISLIDYRQLFWEKRLENLNFVPATAEESRLPATIKPIGPYVTPDTALQVLKAYPA